MAGFGGGGFGGDGGFGGGGDGFGSPSGGAAGSGSGETPKRQMRDRNFTPLTILQINKALASAGSGGGDTIKIDGQEASRFRVCGYVVESAVAEVKARLVLEDGTGRMTFSKWLDSATDDGVLIAEQERARALFEAGRYIMASGELRAGSSGVNANIFEARPVTDFNEVTHHFMDAAFAHLVNTRGPPKDPSAPDALPTSAAASASASSFSGGFGGIGAPAFNPMSTAATLSMPAAGPAAGASAAAPGKVDVQQKVLEAFRSLGTGDDGASIPAVAAHLAKLGINEEQVRSSADNLSLQGHLYSTIDETHFKSTSM